jgi:hypothetical protein
LKIMTSRTASAAAATPLWNSFESAIRQALDSLSASPATVSAFEDMESEQNRIRRTSRHWLLG